MLRHNSALRAVAPVAVLALTLSACGGGDDAGTDAKKSSQPKATASQSKAASGGELATGESATGKVEEEDGKVTYEITAQKVDLGTEAEAEKLVQDKADAKGMALAVAHVKYTHKAGPALTSDSDAGDGTTIWADGQRGTLLLGSADDAPGCEDPYDVTSWKSGESHVFCESYLVPSNAKSLEVHWSEEDGEPYIWKFPNE
ncbi:hypothetical protein AB0H92_00500 [Streptomyces phaeochromogenes]|uniref:hypothetical protein n=1 Tax=Streptomyces phaeochromogenes TaxID=1923 RepID=UPI0006E2E3A1|nr:hypothetical protein [Streptomyces phaeochromogenes]MCX5602027.1 hypothetical protein [Streptomyces phaeochromogenes]WSW19785.1 hypothetical protein OG277_46280 [Streptomyces phaeochromogenes]